MGKVFFYIIFIFAILLSPKFVLAEVEDVKFNFGYPTSETGENSFIFSNVLGESWYSTSKKRWFRGHLGLDISLDLNDPVFVASDGVIDKLFNWVRCSDEKEVCRYGVCWNQYFDDHGWGPTVVIKHEKNDGFVADKNSYLPSSVAQINPEVVYTQYAHLDNVYSLLEGQVVKQGDFLGNVGLMCKWGPHLHFEIKDSEAVEIDRRQSAGAGFGYSGVDWYAPHQYIPQVFIEKNRFVVFPDPEPIPVVVQSITQTEQTQKISFMRSTWNRLSTFMIQSLKRVLSAVPSPEQQEEVVNTNVDVSETQTEEVEMPVERVYGARFVQTEIPVSFVAGAKQVTAFVEVENTGTAVWEKNTISLNVVGGRVPNAMWYSPSWVTQLRPVIVPQRLEGGQKATVSFTVTVPEIDRRLRLQLVRSEGGTYVQVGTALTTVVLSEVIVPPPKPVVLSSPSSTSQSSETDTPSNTQTEHTPILTPFVDTTSLFVRTGGGGGGSSVEETSGDEEDIGGEGENEDGETPTTTPTSTEPTPTSTPTSTEPVVTSTDPLPELSDLSITTPVDPLEVVYTNQSEYVFAGTSDEYTDTIVVTKDDVVIATTIPSGGVWEIPVTLATGTQSVVLYGTASEERQTSSTTVIVVYDAEAPFVDIQLLSVGEGSIVVDLMTYDDSPVSRYDVEFFEVVQSVEEGEGCADGLFLFEAPLLQYYLENDELYVEFTGTYYGCGVVVDTQTVEEPIVSALYDESYSISVRAKGVDAAGNESDWWYSNIPLAFPYEEPGDPSL